MHKWSLTSWKKLTCNQSVNYPDLIQLNRVLDQLSEAPPLITSGEIKNLRRTLIKAGRGEAFILQGGDCAESFNECRSDLITNKLKILLQMSLILIHGLKKPVIRIGRIAGQYAKPRSADFETIKGVTLPSYRGDLINSPSFDAASRIPNPKLMLQGYSCAAVTLNFIRALLDGGFADLYKYSQWDLGFVKDSPQAAEYRSIVNTIADSLSFIEAIDGLSQSNLYKVDFYTSHEALHLPFEQALTRCLHDGLWYNLSTHLPWIGMRTAQTDSAHVELLRGVQNPVGIKLGSSASPELLIELLRILNPHNEEGRILLISRFGEKTVERCLPPFIQAVKKNQYHVTWSCDPMHGNTEVTADGIKTRRFDNVLSELLQTIRIHNESGSHLGGVHFELTGENVTECIGGAGGLNANDLKRAYHSLVDPRLNYEQSLEMALQLSRHFKQLQTPNL